MWVTWKKCVCRVEGMGPASKMADDELKIVAIGRGKKANSFVIISEFSWHLILKI